MSRTTIEAWLQPGRELGFSEWITLPQSMFTAFERLTLSNDPLHMDPDWVRSHTAYPTTIAPGFLTMSLLPHWAAQVTLAPPGHVGVNYGFERLRWPSAVPVGSEVRARFVVAGHKPLAAPGAGVVAQLDVTVEVRGQARPAMVARWLVALMPAAAAQVPQ